MRVLVTGGCGFIGSHFIRLLLSEYRDAQVTNVDCLTYAAHPDTVEELGRLAPSRYEWINLDIAAPQLDQVFARVRPEFVVNFAAESHVDRSILEPDRFVQTNVVGLQNLLTLSRHLRSVRFVHVSTDEVYGSLTPFDPPVTETSPLDPNSPYAATKAAGDLIAMACQRTFGQQVLITRCTNNYGPYQFPEKLLPVVLANALEDRPIPIYGDGKQVRDWIYVEDHCRAIAQVMERGQSGEIYNISAEGERHNIDVVREILTLVGKPHSLIQHVGDRPAHDRRYALNSSKIRQELGWSPQAGFREGLIKTVDWYLANQTWWKSARDREYFKFYHANYAAKFGDHLTEEGAL